MKVSARILLSLGLIVLASLLFSGKSQAFGEGYGNNPPSSNSSTSDPLNTDDNVPKNLHSMTQVIMLETLSAMTCQLAGYDPTSLDHKCLGVNPKTGKIGFVENGGGTIAVMGKLIDYTFTPPASSTQYISYLRRNFGVSKSAYAQFSTGDTNPCATLVNSPKGVGFCGLSPILNLWVTMRNIVYLILILVFVIIGLGIMLRIHVDPRTVMTVQNQIPKIIIGIIAITFSFAIAGFLIDVMWVATYLFAGVINSATNLSDSETLFKIIQAGNPFDAANSLPKDIVDIAGDTSAAFAHIVIDAFGSGRDTGIIGQLVGGAINGVVFLVMIVAIIVALFRLWLSLVLTYINIILDVIFAPFFIVAGLLPGSELGVGAWIRDLVANLAVFPVAISFFLLANYLVGAFQASGSGAITTRFVPPLMGGTDANAVASLIGFGFIMMLPNLLATVKAALKAPKISLGPIMGPVNVGTGLVGGVPKRAVGGWIHEATRIRIDGGKEQTGGAIKSAIRRMSK